MPMNMYPSCETVEYARTFLMSLCVTAIVAATSAVRPPTTAINAPAAGASSYSRHSRAHMYTPAVTIVAA